MANFRGIKKLHELNSVELKKTPKYYSNHNRAIKLAWRFYYHDAVKRRRYEDTLYSLSEEFFLSPVTISVYLWRNDIAKEVYALNPKLSDVIKACLPFACEVSYDEKLKYEEFLKKKQ